jgi:multiple sugar transport system permease protein
MVKTELGRARSDSARGGEPRFARHFRGLIGWAYAAPTAVIVVGLFVAPLGMMAWMSLNQWPLIGDHQFGGLDNYVAVARNDLVVQAVGFTLVYTVVATLILVTFGLGLALLVQEGHRGVGIFRTAFFLPTSIGLAAASLLFLGLYSVQIGPIDPFLRQIGLSHGEIDWLGTPTSALLSSVALIVWRFAGFDMILLLVGLSRIPTDVYEAARIDGANWLQTLRLITLPLLRPSLAMVLILTITGSLLAFDQFYILTRGGPSNSTVSIVMVIYREAFTRFNLGTAAALSLLTMAALVALNSFQLRLLRGSST